MSLLYWLESIRIPAITEMMLLLTHLGEESAFLVTAIIVFWCVSKKRGYYIMTIGFLGTVVNQFLKMWFRVLRPWELHENFTAVEAAKAEATGFSFPSGHTQNSVGTFGALAYTAKHKWSRILSLVIVAIVPFSRMYLGVHTPQDVGVSIVIAVGLVLFIHPIIFSDSKKRMVVLLCGMVVLCLGYLCFVHLYDFPTVVNAERLASGYKNGYTLIGALIGMLLVYIVDEKWLNFQTKAVWWAQIMKVSIGLLLVLLVKSGTKEVLNMAFGESVGRLVRYFLMVVTAGVIWPLSFKWFSQLGNKE